MRASTGSGRREGYTTEMAGLWGDLSRTLAELESIAAARLDDRALELLPTLQYALHRAAELAVGIEPPPGAETAHAELAAALGDARDATAEVVEAAEEGGPEAASTLLHEWRGALFGVRLARLRLATRTAEPPTAPAKPDRGLLRTAALSLALVVAGVAAFAVGATLVLWPLWSGGLALVAAGLLAYRPK